MARTATTVDRSLFETAVEKAEANGPLKNLGDLHNAIVKHYTILTIDDNGLKPISAAIVRDRLAEWKIEVKTEPGRKAKADLFAARMAELVSAVVLIRSMIPAEQADLKGLFDELQYTIERPLEPVVVTADSAESAEDEEIVDPNSVETAETIEPVETALAA